jgi:hypothetical protein
MSLATNDARGQPTLCKQSHYIEVTQGVIFMEQNMRFGLILGWLAILSNYERL